MDVLNSLQMMAANSKKFTNSVDNSLLNSIYEENSQNSSHLSKIDDEKGPSNNRA
jgi:hypothetical protein